MNKKISLLAILSLLTACGGTNSVVSRSTLPTDTKKPSKDNTKQETTVSIVEQAKEKFAVSQDNKKEIVAKAEESTTIDISNYDTIVEIDNDVFKSSNEQPNRSLASRVRASKSNATGKSKIENKTEVVTELSDTEKKYNLIQIYVKWLKSTKDLLDAINQKFQEKEKSSVFTNVIKEGVSIFVGKDEAEEIVKDTTKIVETLVEKAEEIKTAVEEKQETYTVKVFDLSKDFKFNLYNREHYDPNEQGEDESKKTKLLFITDENKNPIGIRLDMYESGNNTTELGDIGVSFKLDELKKDETTNIVSGQKVNHEIFKNIIAIFHKDEDGKETVVGVTSAGKSYETGVREETGDDLSLDLINGALIDKGILEDGVVVSEFLKNEGKPEDGADYEFLEHMIGADETVVKNLVGNGLTQEQFDKREVDLGNGYILRFGLDDNDCKYIYDIVLGGAKADLSYSQFGYIRTTLDIPVKHTNEFYNHTIYGGIDSYKSSIEKVEDGTKFSGYAVGSVFENIHKGNDSVLPLVGSVDLTVSGAESKTEQLKFKFDNWYDIDVSRVGGGTQTISLSMPEGRVISDEIREHYTQENDGKIESLSLNNSGYFTTEYYGFDNKPSEVVGLVSGESSWKDGDVSGEIMFEIGFGAKKVETSAKSE